jgi:hypothetical protein
MKAHRGVLLAAGLLVLSACGVPIQSGAHFTQSWAADRHTTFAWRDEIDRVAGDSRLLGNQVFHRALHEAVEWELALRGIRYTENDPDILVHHHLTLADHVFETEVLDDYGDPTIETSVYEAGSLVVHLVDARSGDDLWIAWGQANVEPAFTGPDAMKHWVYDIVENMFDDWPVPSR